MNFIVSCERSLHFPKTPFIHIMTDDLGNTLQFDEEPKRIISLAPSITEIFFAIDSGKTLVGVTDYCDYPPEAKLKPKVGGMINPNLEKIAELKPDVIVMTLQGNDKSDYYHLKGLGYKVFVIKQNTLDDIYQSIYKLSRLTGEVVNGSAVMNKFKETRKMVINYTIDNKECYNKKVGVIVSLQPLIFAGLDTYITEMIYTFACINAFAHHYMQYPIVNREDVLSKNPDVLIVLDENVKNVEDILKLYPEWKELNATKNEKIVIVDADLFSRPGPRIMQGYELLIDILCKNN